VIVKKFEHKSCIREGITCINLNKDCSQVLYDIYIYITAIGLTPGGSSTSHIYTKQFTEYREKKIGKCGPCPVFASYTLAFALQLRKNHGKPSIRVTQYKNNEQ
jgi:hypothetical protein